MDLVSSISLLFGLLFLGSTFCHFKYGDYTWGTLALIISTINFLDLFGVI